MQPPQNNDEKSSHVSPSGVRCVKCYDIIRDGEATCGACGEKSLSPNDYNKELQKYKTYKKLRFSYFGFHYLTRILLATTALVAVLLTLDVALGNNETSLLSIAKTVISLSLLAIPIYIIIAILMLLLRLKYSVTYRDFKILRKEVLAHNKLFYRTIPKVVVVAPQNTGANSQTETVRPAPDKKVEAIEQHSTKQASKHWGGAIAGFAAVVTIATVAAVSQLNTNSGNYDSASSSNDYRGSTSQSTTSSSKTLSGRWESTNGQTAMIFKGSTVYVGNKYNNDSDLIAECKSWDKGIATYSISGSEITFKYKSGTYTYRLSGTTIYTDDETLVKTE